MMPAEPMLAHYKDAETVGQWGQLPLILKVISFWRSSGLTTAPQVIGVGVSLASQTKSRPARMFSALSGYRDGM